MARPTVLTFAFLRLTMCGLLSPTNPAMVAQQSVNFPSMASPLTSSSISALDRAKYAGNSNHEGYISMELGVIA
jgi:hypothetical protein